MLRLGGGDALGLLRGGKILGLGALPRALRGLALGARAVGRPHDRHVASLVFILCEQG